VRCAVVDEGRRESSVDRLPPLPSWTCRPRKRRIAGLFGRARYVHATDRIVLILTLFLVVPIIISRWD
jgi:hypothetical protein